MSVSGVTASSGQIQMDFMKLLVTQLQNQNPLEPLDNNEMASQLAQMSSLEQLENMSSTFRQVLANEERLQALALIGKEVAFIPDGKTDAVTGRVESVTVTEEGVRVTVGEHTVALDSIQWIRN